MHMDTAQLEVVWKGDTWRTFPTLPAPPSPFDDVIAADRAPRPNTRGVRTHRDLVLGAVVEAPRTLEQVAAAAGVSVGTARLHLAALHAAALVIVDRPRARRVPYRYRRPSVIASPDIKAGAACLGCGQRWAQDGRLCRTCSRATGDLRPVRAIQASEARA